jgi:hypothetical protein
MGKFLYGLYALVVVSVMSSVSFSPSSGLADANSNYHGSSSRGGSSSGGSSAGHK